MSTKIRSAVLRKAGLPHPYAKSKPLQIEDLILAPPGDSEIKIKMKAAGLCHSDLSTINGNRLRQMPLAMGHEACGIIEAVGSRVVGFEVGDHVATSFTPACGHCYECSIGKPQICGPGQVANGASTLLNGATRLTTPDGEKVYHHLGVCAFSTHSVVMPESCVKVDKTIPFEQLALFGCGVITGVGAVVNTAKVPLGATVAVSGMGGVGLSAILGARAVGARRVIAVDVKPAKLDLALSLGATDAVDARDKNAIQKIKEISDDNGNAVGVDFAFEMSGALPALESAIAMTRRGGTITVGGLPPSGKLLGVDIAKLVGEEKKIQGSYMGGCVFTRDTPNYANLMKQGRMPIEKLLSQTMKLEDINEGFDQLEAAEVIRSVITFD